MVRVLVACEISQKVTISLRENGIEAHSNDIQPTLGPRPDWHIIGDVRSIQQDDWKAIIAFPPCTHLCSSGARWWKKKRQDGRQGAAIRLFMDLVESQSPHIAVENPIGLMSTVFRKPDQVIQPWQFGHGETKATCLWLKGFPLLKPTNIVTGREARIHRLPPSKHRSRLRSETYDGVASAMGQQWGDYLKSHE